MNPVYSYQLLIKENNKDSYLNCQLNLMDHALTKSLLGFIDGKVKILQIILAKTLFHKYFVSRSLFINHWLNTMLYGFLSYLYDFDTIVIEHLQVYNTLNVDTAQLVLLFTFIFLMNLIQDRCDSNVIWIIHCYIFMAHMTSIITHYDYLHRRIFLWSVTCMTL